LRLVSARKDDVVYGWLTAQLAHRRVLRLTTMKDDSRPVDAPVEHKPLGLSAWSLRLKHRGLDSENIESSSHTYDAVFEFGILHHIPEWRRALAEIARVLRPGGHFLFEELSREFFYETGPLGWVLRRYTDHPWAQMFDWPSFAHGLTEGGLKLIHHEPAPVPGWNRDVAVRS